MNVRCEGAVVKGHVGDDHILKHWVLSEQFPSALEPIPM